MLALIINLKTCLIRQGVAFACRTGDFYLMFVWDKEGSSGAWGRAFQQIPRRGLRFQRLLFLSEGFALRSPHRPARRGWIWTRSREKNAARPFSKRSGTLERDKWTWIMIKGYRLLPRCFCCSSFWVEYGALFSCFVKKLEIRVKKEGGFVRAVLTRLGFVRQVSQCQSGQTWASLTSFSTRDAESAARKAFTLSAASFFSSFIVLMKTTPSSSLPAV